MRILNQSMKCNIFARGMWLLLVLLLVFGFMPTLVLAAEPPAIPTGIHASSESYNSIQVSWDAVAGADGYSIYRAPKSSGPYTYLRLVSGTSFVDPGVTTGHTYYYRVRAYTLEGSTRVYGTFAPAVAARPIPSKPGGLTIDSSTYTTVSLSWDAVEGATGYRIYRQSSGSFSKITETVDPSYQDTGLRAGTTYTYKVMAYCTVGSTTIGGYTSDTVSAQTQEASGMPTSISASSASYNSIQVSWDAVAGADGYSIYRAPKSSGPYTYLRLVSGTSFIDPALTTGQTYYYRVRSYLLDGSTRIYGTFAPAVAARPIPAAPQNLGVTNQTYTTVSLSWDAVEGATGYRIYRQSGSSAYTQVADVAATSYINTGLRTGTVYNYKVAAYRTMGSTKIGGYQSVTASAQTVAGTGIPTSISASSISYNSIQVSWDTVANADGYSIYRATKSSGPYTYLRLVSGTSFVDSGLTTGQTYYYRVRSYIMDGSARAYGTFAPAVAARTIPAKPTNLSYSNGNPYAISVGWHAVEGASGYQLWYSTSEAGTYSYVTTTSGLAYTHTGLDGNRYYYYKVRAYRMVGGKVIYGGFSDVLEAFSRNPFDPYYSVICPSQTITNASVLLIRIDNHGPKPMRILSNGCVLIDSDYSGFNRDLRLIDSNLNPISWMEIPAQSWSYVYFEVIGDPTYYGSSSGIFYEFRYDTVMYLGLSTRDTGSGYWLLD